MNILGIDLKPLLAKTTEFTEQQKQIIALLTDQNQLLEQIKQLLTK